ncbi:MAG: hypothetical protein HQK49_02205 [Oligoflexia bacterium]|nr:hypothetical protein [Oligoflexia bacterium]
MKHNEQKCLTGYLSPISWSNSGKVKSYSVFTDENEDVILAGNHLEEDFKMFKNQKVKLFGTFIRSNNEARIFEVKRTNPLSFNFISDEHRRLSNKHRRMR